MRPFYITTPIYYVNDKPHIGHAYTTVAADVLARWKRMRGEKVFFLTGTDEHGSKIAQAAEKVHCSPQEYADQLVSEFKSLWKVLNISNDDFIRTTEDRHMHLVQKVFQKLYDQGEIVKGFYEGWYCVPCETFRLENELVEKKCPDCGREVERVKEESYFFKLSNYGDKLLKYYEQNPNFLSPNSRAQEIVHFVKGGLKDLSVSRLKESWGIPVPFDSHHTVYVWFDALFNYLSAVGYKIDREDGIKNLWPCDIHFVGKEIFRFHTIVWPAILFALNLPLPQMVFAHGWWTVEGQKISKSIGNIVDPVKVVEEFGLDGFRYFLLRGIPFGADGDFSRNAFLNRYNFELANDLGNLFSRTVTLIEKNFEKVLRKVPEGIFLPLLEKSRKDIIQSFEKIAFQEVLEQLALVVREMNRYIDQKAPWNLVKVNREETENVLSEIVIVLRWLACAYFPFMPDSARRMWEGLGGESDLAELSWQVFENPMVAFSSGWRVHRGPPLFPRK